MADPRCIVCLAPGATAYSDCFCPSCGKAFDAWHSSEDNKGTVKWTAEQVRVRARQE
jgi:hypothetical protein